MAEKEVEDKPLACPLNLLKMYSDFSLGEVITDNVVSGNVLLLKKGTKIKQFHLDLLKEWPNAGLDAVENNELRLPKIDERFKDFPGVKYDKGLFSKIKFTKLQREMKHSSYESIRLAKNLTEDFVDRVNDKDYIMAVSELGQLVDLFKSGAEFSVEKYQKLLIKRFYQSLLHNDYFVLAAAETSRQLHDSTLIHQYNTAKTAFLIASSIQLISFSDRKVKGSNNIIIGSLLHDMGKVLDDKIKGLISKGKLSEKEMDKVREHPEIAYRYLDEYGFDNNIKESVLYHHEKYDGTGYPEGLSGKAIPDIAALLAVADKYEALKSVNRNYRSKNLTKTDTFKILVTELYGTYSQIFFEKYNTSNRLKKDDKDPFFQPLAMLLELNKGLYSDSAGSTSSYTRSIINR